MDIEEVKSKLVWLGISGATDDQVKATFEKYDLDKSNSLEFEVSNAIIFIKDMNLTILSGICRYGHLPQVPRVGPLK